MGVVAVQVLRAGTLFDGEVRRTGVDLLVDRGRVVGVQPSQPPPDGADLVDLGPGVTLLPGLVDAHQHLTMDASPDVVAAFDGASDDLLLDRARTAARTALAAGVTTVRDLGDRGYLTLRLRDELAADPAAGPRLLTSGPPVTTPGGHCWWLGGEAAGHQALAAAVRERVDRGVDVVKVMATGGNITPGSDPGRSQYGAAELGRVVALAHAAGLRVAVHAHGRDGIAAAVACGADSIEHFSFMTADSVAPDEALIDQVATAQLPVVLTPGIAPGHPPADAIAGRLGALLALQRRLCEVGVWFALGTDAGVAPGKPHDVMPYAVAMPTWVGHSAQAALTAATSRAARVLGLDGEVGVLRPGASADVLAVNGDPTVDPAALVDVVAVYRNGQRVAGALRRPPAVRPGPVSS